MLVEASASYAHQLRTEASLPAPFRNLSRTFPDGTAFVCYFNRAPKWSVQMDGWRQTVIKTTFGENRTEVLRYVMKLLCKVLKDAGGLSALVQVQAMTES